MNRGVKILYAGYMVYATMFVPNEEVYKNTLENNDISLWNSVFESTSDLLYFRQEECGAPK
jgi:hypothetical protein